MVQSLLPANEALARARGDPDPPIPEAFHSVLSPDIRLRRLFWQSQAALEALSTRDGPPKIRGDLIR
jgi:hypothetical protein